MQLAQFNVSKQNAPLDDPSMKDFMDGLARINSLAEASEGFVWRLHDETGNATAIRVFEDRDIIFNLSVWTSIELLHRFVYHSQHLDVLKRRYEWFRPMSEKNYVLWWIPETHRPSTDEAKERLQHLRTHGESNHAFTFARPYGYDGTHAGLPKRPLSL